jgi:hypothetical protein
VSRKGKASPLEAGRGKYSPPVNLERVTSEGLKRRNKGVHTSKIKYTINSIVYKNIANRSQETPETQQGYRRNLFAGAKPIIHLIVHVGVVLDFSTALG